MTMLGRGSHVYKDGHFGIVDTVIERYQNSILVSRILVVEWDDRNVSDEDEDQLGEVLPGAGVNPGETSDQELSSAPSPRPSLTKSPRVG